GTEEKSVTRIESGSVGVADKLDEIEKDGADADSAKPHTLRKSGSDLETQKQQYSRRAGEKPGRQEVYWFGEGRKREDQKNHEDERADQGIQPVLPTVPAEVGVLDT